MARVSTYLNFQGQTEEAFAFYATTFGTQITMLSRYSDMPAAGPASCPQASRTSCCMPSFRSSAATC
jgi:PhnB protein